MKNITLLIGILFITTFSFSQKSKSAKMGQATLEELQMTVYDKDSTAVAVVLYEQGNTFMNPAKDHNLSTTYYYRIKILKKEGFKKGIIQVPFYKKESIDDVKAITYNIVANSIQKKHLLDKDIFENKETENWTTLSFTLPDIKVGSVIEYSYTYTTPYFQQLDDWYFQSDIPKIKSEYESAILGNYMYNVGLKGFLKLNKNNPSVIKRCVNIPGLTQGGCTVLSLGMNHIPAFKEEGFMTSKKNFISRVTFELETFTNASGSKIRYTDTWKSTDKKFKSGEYFGSELRKSNFFKKNLPKEIITESNALTKAKNIYYFIQNHYTNNGKSFSYNKIDTKRSFNDKNGTLADINISLFNALKSADLDVKIALLSTRNNGLPTKVYPVITDFNYVIVLLKIADKEYFLDATNKRLTFGLTPFSTLNGDVRVMDFKEGSYWKALSPNIDSNEKIDLSVTITDIGEIKGLLRVINTGYEAYTLKSELNSSSEESYLEKYESDNNLEVNDYKISGLDRKSNQISQTFNFNFETTNDGLQDKIYFNPFFHEKTQSNPFQLTERLYPVNFGYKRNYTYRASISLPENYTIGELPKSRAFSLPNNGGSFIFNIKKINSKITIYYKFQLNKVEYTNVEYFALKEFFNQIVKAQSTIITLEKK
ncbi:DUF3857 domain-containing protein [Polaribacter uvawellassae]|uniref:DUF3857 domain-containing protein n=1 Tax=Polaribacter uvawellassae TaxID=3133495 RepID=UPI003219C1DF